MRAVREPQPCGVGLVPRAAGLPPDLHRGLLGTDEPLGVFDDEMEVAAFLAFEKLDRDRVEVLADRSPMATLTG